MRLLATGTSGGIGSILAGAVTKGAVIALAESLVRLLAPIRMWWRSAPSRQGEYSG